MEDNSEVFDLHDASINDALRSLDHALQNPTQKTSSGISNDLNHLVNEFGAEDVDENIVELIEEIIHESGPNTATPSSLAPTRPSSAALIAPELKEKPSRSSVGLFISKLFGKTRRQPSENVSEVSSIPSINSTNNQMEIDPSALQAAEDQIKILENQGPAGLVDVSALGNVVNRKIQVWTSGLTLYQEVGKTRPGPALNIQYHTQPAEVQGHWTLLGNETPDQIEAGLNDCLFAAIAAQVGRKPSELRAATIEKMKENIQSLGNRIQELARREECGRIVLMIGGAKYDGSSAADAKRVIDDSQNARCHPDNIKGHPRGHASYPQGTGPTDSAENYSRDGMKSAFLSREDQDQVGHQVLTSQEAQTAMEKLNQGSPSYPLRIPATTLSNLPQGAEFVNGQRAPHDQPIKELVMVLRHHIGHAGDANHDVFVHTFYPVLR